MNKLRYLASVAIALVIGFAGLAAAQNYPARPITIIVPFAAGGGNDILARLLGQHMGRALGQNFVIENRAGAAGTIGARAVAKAPPDGYALMVGHSGVFGVAPALYGANAGYDPRKDFSPIGLIASFTQILVVHPTLPVHTVKDLIAHPPACRAPSSRDSMPNSMPRSGPPTCARALPTKAATRCLARRSSRRPISTRKRPSGARWCDRLD
jgi:tripartite-type tricarboxylate transporter receptor subunit TctC